jgi:hypothetical protein
LLLLHPRWLPRQPPATQATWNTDWAGEEA